MHDEPTTRQWEVLMFIKDFIAEKRMSPSVRDVMNHFGFSSPNGVVCHFKALKEKGLIEWNPSMARSVRLTDDAQREWTGIPVIDIKSITRA